VAMATAPIWLPSMGLWTGMLPVSASIPIRRSNIPTSDAKFDIYFPHFVIPAKAGIQLLNFEPYTPMKARGKCRRWIPAFAGMTS
jgi:hypothetical protein